MLLFESIASSRSRLRLSFTVLDHVEVFEGGKDGEECSAWQLEQFLSDTAGNCRTSLVLHILVSSQRDFQERGQATLSLSFYIITDDISTP